MSSGIYYTCSTDYTDSDDLLKCIADNIENEHQSIQTALATFFMLYAAALVFFMQAGFAMLCAGSVRQKNVQNTMLKNFLDVCSGAISFWAFGYAFAYGGSTEKILSDFSESEYLSVTFIGSENFFMAGLNEVEQVFWLFQFAFAATSATIVAGTLAERCQMVGYILYSVTLTGFIYPVVVHTVWSRRGFLSSTIEDPLFGVGMLDFAGSGVVHVTGGTAALLASIVLGPRKGRFYNERTGDPLPKPKEIPGHSASLQVIGTFILWFSWYGFNPGSVQSLRGSGASVGALAAVTTTLSAAAGGAVALATDTILEEHKTGEAIFNLQACLNGCLSGLIAITAGCAVVEPWAAIVIGSIAGWVYLYSARLLIQFRIDDAVNAIPVHLANGIWGVIATGLFATGDNVSMAYGIEGYEGLFYAWGDSDSANNNGSLLGAQICGLLFIIGWVCVLMYPFFVYLNYTGWFRADALEEVVGLDISYHGGRANEFDEQPKLEALEFGKISSKKRAQRLHEILEERSSHGGTRLHLNGTNNSDHENFTMIPIGEFEIDTEKCSTEDR